MFGEWVCAFCQYNIKKKRDKTVNDKHKQEMQSNGMQTQTNSACNSADKHAAKQTQIHGKHNRTHNDNSKHLEIKKQKNQQTQTHGKVKLTADKRKQLKRQLQEMANKNSHVKTNTNARSVYADIKHTSNTNTNTHLIKKY